MAHGRFRLSSLTRWAGLPRFSLARFIWRDPAFAFSGLVHYDPWWAFRGVSGVNRSWIEAIFATNIARPFRYANRTWKIHDLVFADGIGHLDSVVAKDEFFRAKTFGQRDLDLLRLRSSQGSATSARRTSSTAKAL